MVNNAKQDKKAKIIILVVTLALTILFATLGAVLPGRNMAPDSSNNNNSNNNNNGNGGNSSGTSHHVSGTLYVNSYKTVSLSGTFVYYSFTPSSSGTYVFTSVSNYDTYATLYNSSWGTLTSDDDSGDGSNFGISYYLSSGNTYYLGVRLYSSSSGPETVSLYVSRY
ncbi:MAG: hypothetical protein K2L52_05560 [Clostridia bacterium]|nr:hypothetical protein [Clostridia bacterium]